MSINLGDAILRFLADTTELDAAFDKAATDAETKLPPVAEAVGAIGEAATTAGEQTEKATDTISAGWDVVQKTTKIVNERFEVLAKAFEATQQKGGQNASTMKTLVEAFKAADIAVKALDDAQEGARASGVALTKAEQQIAEAAKATGQQASAALKDVSAAIDNTAAKSSGLASALAGLAGGIIAMVAVQALMSGIQYLMEYQEKVRQLRRDLQDLDTAWRDSSRTVQEELTKQEQKIIELTDGPIAGLEFAIRRLGSSAEDSLGRVSQLLDSTAETFKKNGGMFNLNDEAAKKLEDFRVNLTEAMRVAEAANPGDNMAGYREGIRLTDEAIVKLQVELKNLQDRNEAIKKANEQRGGMDPLVGITAPDTKPYEQAIDRLRNVRQLLIDGTHSDYLRQKELEKRMQDELVSQSIQFGSAQLEAGRASSNARLTLQIEQARIRYSRGLIDEDQLLRAEQAAADRRYENDRAALVKRRTLLEQDPTKNASQIEAINGQLQALEADHQVALLRIQDAAYRRNAANFVQGMQELISAARRGTQERADLEAGLAEYLRQTWGENSEQYRQATRRAIEAARDVAVEQQRIAVEEMRGELQVLAERRNGVLQYYQFLAQTARISAATLAQIRFQTQMQAYVQERAALERQLAQLGAEETQQRTRILNQIKLLDERFNTERVLANAQANEAIQQSFEQLGVKSSEMWKRKAELAKEAFDKIKASGVATYQDLLLAEMAYLTAKIEAASTKEEVEEEREKLERLTRQYTLLEIQMGKTRTAGGLMGQIFRSLGIDARLMGNTVQNVAMLVAGAVQTMALAFASGGQTITQVMQQVAAAILQSIARYAFAKGTEELALGFAAMSPWGAAIYGPPGPHFTSAALWFAAGAATSVAAGFVAGAGRGGESASQQQFDTKPAEGVQQGPVQQAAAPVRNVPRFARGALVMEPTLAIIGDKITSPTGRQKEAAIPLEEPDVMNEVGDSIAKHIPRSAGGGNTFIIQGLVSDDNLMRIMRRINKLVDKNDVQLSSSRTRRVERKA